MTKKISEDDVPMDAEVEPVTDESIADETPADVAPEEVDLSKWLAGLGPDTATYPLAGMSFTLEARSPVWYEQWRGEVKDGDLDADEAALRFLAGHIIQPEGVTVEALRTIRESRWREVDEMAKLAVELDGNPVLMALMEPGFLPGASD